MPSERERNGHPTGPDSPADALARARAAAAAVVDPEIPILTLEDLGILRGVAHKDGQIVVELTPTYIGCPATFAIRLAVEAALAAAGLPEARVVTQLSPPWSTEAITETGRRKLKAFGIAPPARATGPGALFRDAKVACPRCGSTKTSKLSEFGSTACKAQWRCDACREPFDYFKCI
jgi:ring-1,2-phenylacetyl-CoA epoxidase subunit PaaD